MHTQWVKISLALILTKTASASFSIYANYDHHAIAAALGISSYCLSALNQTVECDQANAARAARGVDNDCNIPTVATMTCSDTLHLDWSKENLTTLCTNTCSNSLATWLSTVEARCSRDQVTANGIIFEPKTFPLKYISGHDLACLQDSSETFCILESQKWNGNAKIKWDMEVCYDEDPPEFCDEEMFFDEDQSVAVTDLYHQDQYCSECFLLLWRQRLLSPTLPPGNFTDYLIDQFKVLADTCSTDLPFSTSAPTLILGTATSVPDAGQRIRTKNATTASSAPAAPTEAIYKRSIAPRVPLYTTTAVPPKPTQPGTIAACGAYYEVTEGDTCISICKQFGIDYVDLLSYNTQLDDGCNNLWKNYAICIGPVTTLPSTTLEAPSTSSSSSTVPQTTVSPEPPQKISKDGKCMVTAVRDQSGVVRAIVCLDLATTRPVKSP
ncbi:hypothetical protein LOZ58_000040 [Ophidiomyces ophidiicola]|nr:hypothetical protein LOZ58_000040 [Ophidiomyces ophidiicola]